jgi:hypothetical protein
LLLVTVCVLLPQIGNVAVVQRTGGGSWFAGWLAVQFAPAQQAVAAGLLVLTIMLRCWIGNLLGREAGVTMLVVCC